VSSFKSIIQSLASKILAFQHSESKFVWILIAIGLLILFNPLLPNQGWGVYIFHVFLMFIVLSGIFAASNERQIVWQITVLGLFVIVLAWIQFLVSQEFPVLSLLVYALYAVVVGFITVAIILTISKSQKVTANIICGAVSGYLLNG